ncbi:N-(5'-phosphoribosyl)anthranilate isomerase [candidate division KSB1 bacterium]|nr:N-(5'-phosphoribosyl)anthranilate isomerase [candidate division KSB1 bacterium]
MWLKLCGCTNSDDARAIAGSGADAVGFVFAPGPRRVSAEAAQHLARICKNLVRIGVFVDEDIETVNDIRSTCKLDAVQLHGSESPQYCRRLGGTLIKAFRLRDSAELQQMQHYPMVWKFLIDAFVPGRRGGTGKRIGDDLLIRVSNPDNVIVAGGVNKDNLRHILGLIQPFGLDVSSGVEKSPGLKDKVKINQLITTIRE